MRASHLDFVVGNLSAFLVGSNSLYASLLGGCYHNIEVRRRSIDCENLSAEFVLVLSTHTVPASFFLRKPRRRVNRFVVEAFGVCWTIPLRNQIYSMMSEKFSVLESTRSFIDTCEASEIIPIR